MISLLLCSLGVFLPLLDFCVLKYLACLILAQLSFSLNVLTFSSWRFVELINCLALITVLLIPGESQMLFPIINAAQKTWIKVFI